MTDTTAPEPTSAGEVGWGILATGGIARLFARDLAAHGHRIAAVGSRTPEAAQRFAEEFDVPTAHGSYADLVADPQVDVVYVATPHHLHVTNACDALANGKHVLVEKAFTLNADEARRIVDLGRERRLLVMEAMWTRFLPHMAYVREVIAAGRIGAIRSLHADHTQNLPTEPTHRLNDLAVGGGALLDLGSYPLAFAHDLLGTPTGVMAHGVIGPTGVDESVATILDHGEGVVSTSFSTMRSRGSNRAVVLGSEGRIEIDAVWYSPASVTVLDAKGTPVDRFEQAVSGRGMQYQAAEVERLLTAGETASPLMPPEESVAVMATMDQVRAAIGVRYPGE
ncbi:Gfo/Idh/MocA family protein [Egicoccus sp. AB-alg6-2]|uniref:Gfo/Idh/MocA family protein n=1 Tax=Egicoccus sp. AB-alg6-2 TaxID=3242692 RepID=UPI00359ED78F